MVGQCDHILVSNSRIAAMTGDDAALSLGTLLSQSLSSIENEANIVLAEMIL